jgi:hypothetical protein
MRRMWINQPSKLQPHHSLHGTNVLVGETPPESQYWTVFFTSGKQISSLINKIALSPGWVEEQQKQEDAFEVPASTTYVFGTKELAEQFTKERIFDPVSCQMKNAPAEKDTGAHYRFQLTQLVTEVDLQRGYTIISLDPYKVADCYGITNHAIFSALKKLLVAGGRGFKDSAQDVADSIGALQRWQEMQEEQATLAKLVGKSLKSKETSLAPAICTTVGRDKENLAILRAMQAGFGNPVEPMTLEEALKIKRLGDV